MPGYGPAKRQGELMPCRRAATADGSDVASARRRGGNLCVKGLTNLKKNDWKYRNGAQIRLLGSGSGSFLLLGVSPKPPLLDHRFHLGAAGQQDRSSGGMLVAAQKCRTFNKT